MFKKRLVSLLAWSISLSLFHFGYFVVFMTKIPIPTLKLTYETSINDAVVLGILNGCIPLGGLFGSIFSSFFISKFSRRYYL